MTDCNCDDDMTEDGHGHACPNSITVRLAAEYARGVADERARVVAWLKAKRKVSDDAERFAEEISEGYHKEAT